MILLKQKDISMYSFYKLLKIVYSSLGKFIWGLKYLDFIIEYSQLDRLTRIIISYSKSNEYL